MTQAKMSLAQLIMQYQTASRTNPSPADAFRLPFDGFDLSRDPRRQVNNSVTSSPLASKTDAGSPIVPEKSMTGILDLRNIGFLLKLLLGQPTTTGTGPYTHSFPVNLNARPYALFEMQHTDISKFFRWLDVHCTKLAWDIRNNEQMITASLLAGIEIDPVPTSAFDATPTTLSSFRANSGSGVISNGADAALGQIIGGNIEIGSVIKPEELANGLDGYSVFTPEEVTFKGKIKCIYEGEQAYLLARNGTSTRLKMVSGATIGANTFSLSVDMPYVELKEAAPPRKGRSGIIVEHEFAAHAGATLPTVELINDVASY
ncbi:MAG TPA: phage tail tube protein [Sideroxyarcus sp.]|nr:phage tail tube protein [Sideroxyarcus sp.]